MVNMQRVLTLALFLVFIKKTVAASCDSFKNVTMTVHPDGGKRYTVTITGCIERRAFQDPITRADIKAQIIPKLGRDSVRHMVRLHTVIFDRCGIEVIEPGAFRNVPSLKLIKIINGDLTTVPEGVFPPIEDLEQLKLNNNKIKTIEGEAFAYLLKLKKIRCDHNKLEEFQRKWFTNCTNLEIMDFSFNKIRILPRRAFYELPQLKEINFEHNELEVIESEVFKGITELRYLGLKYNRLKTIHPKVFPNKISINSMTLGANYLNYLSKKIIVNLTVNQLTIDGNPWKCPCLDQVLFWLHEINATAKQENSCLGADVPVCAVPNTFSKTCAEVYEDDVTDNYLNNLRKVNPPLEKYCARLD